MGSFSKNINKPSVTIVGWINKGKPADCGETMKNQLLINKLERLGVHCRQIDFKNWKRRPWVFLQFACALLAYQSETMIMSTSAVNLTLILKFFRAFRLKRNTVFWVIGGAFADDIKNGRFSSDDFKYLKHIIVESKNMRSTLKSCGFSRVITLPNFKPITYYPRLHVPNSVLRFVFLSRIMPEKGCDYILNAARKLVDRGYGGKFVIDFYGKIAEDYKQYFLSEVDSIDGVNYNGFLNLCENAGYDRLSEYDMMLFPTYWKGEGFAGVFVDSFIAGVPMIASDWAHNCEFLDNGRTAIIIPTHDESALAEKMAECIDGKYDLFAMSERCQRESEKYNVDNLVTDNLLRQVEIIR